MAGDLQAGFSNNVNVVAIRAQATTDHIYTDRAIDLDGDGTIESVTETHVSGHAPAGGGKVRTTITKPDGIARSVVSRTTETDSGVNISGSEFTEGVE